MVTEENTDTMNSIDQTQQNPPERLAYTGDELSKLLGLSKITLWRLEKRGQLVPVPGIRNKLYSKAAVEKFLSARPAA